MPILIAMQGIMLMMLTVAVCAISRMRREITEISEQVRHYLKVVMETENEEELQSYGEEESRIISAVLGEIFP